MTDGADEPASAHTTESDLAPGSARRLDLLERLRNEAILHADESTRVQGRRGERAAWMLYCWPVTMTSDGLALAADELLELLAPFEATTVAAYGLGSLPLMSACVLRSGGRLQGLSVRKETKPYGACRQIDGLVNAGQKVVLLDDSISSGTSFRAAALALERAGYEVEGTACLVNFPFRGGVESARARGYRVETAFDIWDLHAPPPERPPMHLRLLPESWSDEQLPDGLHPAVASRMVIDHLLRTGDVLRPPHHFATEAAGPGGVWVSLRRRADDHRVARDGFWHFDPSSADPTRDVVIAATGCVRQLGARLTIEALAKLKVAVSFFSELELVEPRDLDFDRYGIVVRSRAVPAKMGGALPNTQLFTSTFEQYHHARVTNAKIGDHEPHDVFRHDIQKMVEPGETWPAYGFPRETTDTLEADGGLGESIIERIREVIAAMRSGDELGPGLDADDLVRARRLAAVGVSLYDRGLLGCSVAGGNGLDEMVVRATRGALGDQRFAGKQGASDGPVSITVSLLHDSEQHGVATTERIAWKLRAGADSFMAAQGAKKAIFLDFVIPQFSWSKEQAAKALLNKAGITDGATSWVTYKTTSWGRIGDHVRRLESGAIARTAESRLTESDVALMSDHLMRRLDLNNWPATGVLPRSGKYLRTGHAARCIHALQTLHRAGVQQGRPDWRQAAVSGIEFAAGALSDTPPPELRMRDHTCGPTADAILLSAITVTSDLGDGAPKVAGPLADRVASWIQPDGSIRAEGTLRASADSDFLPGNAILALARFEQASGATRRIDWASTREWYTRRFRTLHSWGLAYWHAQAWAAVAELTGDESHLAFVFEAADWMVERQLRTDGSFFTDMCPTGPSFHTACGSIGIAAAWRAASTVGDAPRARRYAQSWRDSMHFLDRLLVRTDDTYWMSEPSIARGGVRHKQASYNMRVDMTSEVLQALLMGLAAEGGGADQTVPTP